MAFTYTKIQETVIGNLRCWIGTLTFDSSYPTGGLAYTVANFGMANTPVFLGFDGGTGYIFQNDRANSKILAYRTAGITPAGTVAAPTLTMNSYTPAGTNAAATLTSGTNATTTAPVYTVGGAITQTTGAAGITGIQAAAFSGTPAVLTGSNAAPAFTGTAVAAASLTEVANAVNLSAVVINVFVVGI